MKLHLGCGTVRLEGYVNIDIERWTAAVDVVANALDLNMYEDNSIEHIFTHAMLEHIPCWDTIKALKEWYRILKPGGTIQVEVPDLERIYADWIINKSLDEQEAIDNIFGRTEEKKAYKNQHHLTGFTYDRLVRFMKECGFTNFKRLEHPVYRIILVVWAEKL